MKQISLSDLQDFLGIQLLSFLSLTYISKTIDRASPVNVAHI